MRPHFCSMGDLLFVKLKGLLPDQGLSLADIHGI